MMFWNLDKCVCNLFYELKMLIFFFLWFYRKYCKKNYVKTNVKLYKQRKRIIKESPIFSFSLLL